MKKMIYVLLFVFLYGLTIDAAPKLGFSCGLVYDFGLVRQKDSPLKTEITLYNNSSDTMIIERVKPNCGCTTAPLSKKVLAPKDSAILKVTLNVEHYEHEIEKRINFKTNLSSDETILYLRANVYKPFSLFPSKYFNFSQMYVGEETVSKIVISNLSGRDLNILSIENESSDMELNIKPGDIIPKDTDLVVEAKVKPTTLGPYTFKLNITIDDTESPVIQLSGFGRVDPIENKAKDYHQVEDPVVSPQDVMVNPVIDENDNNPNLNPKVVVPENAPIKIQPGEVMPIERIPAPGNPDRRMKIPPLPPGNEVIKQSPAIKVEPLPVEPNPNETVPKKEEVKKK